MFSLIIPMYNEEKILPDTIKTLHAYMESAFDDYEIVFADDGSTDRSRKIVEECGHERMRVVGYEKNRGKGCAVRCGMLAARGDIRLFTDCDLAYGTEIIRTLYDKFTAAGCDVMIGSRNLSGDGYEGYTALRRIVSKTYIRVLCTIGGFKLSDSQCGFKAFSAKAAEDVFSRCETDGFAFDFEAILFATKLGYKIAELPVKIINHRPSTIHFFRDSMRMLRDVRKIKKRIKRLKLNG